VTWGSSPPPTPQVHEQSFAERLANTLTNCLRSVRECDQVGGVSAAASFGSCVRQRRMPFIDVSEFAPATTLTIRTYLFVLLLSPTRQRYPCNPCQVGVSMT
jgi:hypothetical protein